MLSADWVLDTDDTLELLTNPNAANFAVGSLEYPGGRSPDFGRLAFTAFEQDDFFKSANKQNKFSVDSREENTISVKQQPSSITE